MFYKLESPAELSLFLKEHETAISKTKIKKLYNLGGPNFPEYSLYVLTETHAINLFFYDDLLVSIYPKAYFFEHLNNGIFRYSTNEFDYIWPEATEVNRLVKSVKPKINRYHDRAFLDGIDILLSGKAAIHIRASESVPGAMNSWYECPGK